MNEYIACCGLNCEKCDAYIATETNDEELRKRTAKLWSELNGVDITPDMINCSGCRRDGVKTPYCGYVCAIRKCAMEKKFETCGSCDKFESCEILGQITDNNSEAKENLR